jgi:uncharacterized protein (DUF2147 family)
MKSLYLTAAALLLASTAAHAGSGVSFQIDGQKIHVEQPRGCNSLSCLQITAPGLSAKSFNLNNINLNGSKSKSDDDDEVATTKPAQPAPQAAPAPAPVAAAPVQQAPAPVANTAPPPPPAPTAAPAPIVEYAPANPAPVTAPAPAPQVATAAPVQQAAPVAAPAPAPTTPVGLWATEDNKGNVRIENCGQNLCGYAEKSGERILINMKPDGNKWTGRIHDPDGGSNYDSTIAMKGPNTLKVQGCAFGGMFCGGQTWKRIS